jgi:FAD-dependent urate hydroxylase
MIFGRRAFFGYVTDPAGGTVWFANVPRGQTSRPERQTTTAQQWQQQLLELFADDNGPATDLIAAGQGGQMVFNGGTALALALGLVG